MRVVQSLEPKVKAYEVVDTELAGFILRVQPSGSMDYYISPTEDVAVGSSIFFRCCHKGEDQAPVSSAVFFLSTDFREMCNRHN